MLTRLQGEKLKKYRLDKNFRQLDMANLLKIGVTSFHNKETGFTEFKLSEIVKIKEVLELDDEMFLDLFINI